LNFNMSFAGGRWRRLIAGILSGGGSSPAERIRVWPRLLVAALHVSLSLGGGLEAGVSSGGELLSWLAVHSNIRSKGAIH